MTVRNAFIGLHVDRSVWEPLSSSLLICSCSIQTNRPSSSCPNPLQNQVCVAVSVCALLSNLSVLLDRNRQERKGEENKWESTRKRKPIISPVLRTKKKIRFLHNVLPSSNCLGSAISLNDNKENNNNSRTLSPHFFPISSFVCGGKGSHSLVVKLPLCQFLYSELSRTHRANWWASFFYKRRRIGDGALVGRKRRSSFGGEWYSPLALI